MSMLAPRRSYQSQITNIHLIFPAVLLAFLLFAVKMIPLILCSQLCLFQISSYMEFYPDLFGDFFPCLRQRQFHSPPIKRSVYIFCTFETVEDIFIFICTTHLHTRSLKKHLPKIYLLKFCWHGTQYSFFILFRHLYFHRLRIS